MLERPGQTRSSRAFTLVELLVVIGIIAVLVGILLPALNRAREEANSLKCLSNLRTIGQAVSIYEIVWNGWLPPAETGPGGANSKDTHWDLLLQTMIGRTGGDTYATAGAAGMVGQAFICPSHFIDPDPNGTYECDYSAQPRLMPRLNQPGGGDVADYGDPVYPPAKVKMHQIKGSEIPHSTDVILVMDSVQLVAVPAGSPLTNTSASNYSAQDVLECIDGRAYLAVNYNPTAGTGGRLCSTGFSSAYMGSQIYVPFKLSIAYESDSNFDGELGTIAWRHYKNTSANALFLDGHADSYTIGNNPNAASVLVGASTTRSPSYKTNLMRTSLYTPYR